MNKAYMGAKRCWCKKLKPLGFLSHSFKLFYRLHPILNVWRGYPRCIKQPVKLTGDVQRRKQRGQDDEEKNNNSITKKTPRRTSRQEQNPYFLYTYLAVDCFCRIVLRANKAFFLFSSVQKISHWIRTLSRKLS